MGDAASNPSAPVARRICDGSAEIRLAIGYGVGGQLVPFTSVLYELGMDFLYVDGTCHYWAQQPISIVDEYYAWRPYREGVLSPEQERQLYDGVGYDNVTTSACASRPVVTDGGGGGPFLWDGRQFHPCFDWTEPVNVSLRTELFDAAAAVTGPMRIQVGRTSIGPNTSVYEWPLDAPIEQYVIADGETRSFRVDDTAAVVALRALRRRAIADAEVAPGFFASAIALEPREGDASYVLSLRDELPFVDAQGSWLPASATPATDDTQSSSSDVGANPPTRAQCDEWSSNAGIGRGAAVDAADRACSDEGDCTIVDFGVSCIADCGYSSSVARAAVPALRAEVQSLQNDNCVPFEERGCPEPIPLPCVPLDGEPRAVCRGGQCTLELVPSP